MGTKKIKNAVGTTDKAAGKSGKKAKLPKRIAGVKVPKQLRGPGAALLEGINSPIGREMLGAGLAMVAAAAVARSKTGRDVTDTAAKGAAKGAAKAGEAASQDASQIVDAISAAATAVIKRVIDAKTKT